MQQDISGDVVTEQWLRRHRISIPRATGLFESDTAWVKVGKGGVIVEASERDKSLMAHLIGRKVLDPHHAEYSFCFMELRHAFLSRTLYKSNSVFLDQLFGVSLSDRDAASMYIAICTALGKARVRIIHAAVENRAAPSNTHLTNTAAKQHREAFTALVRALEAERTKRREEETACARP